MLWRSRCPRPSDPRGGNGCRRPAERRAGHAVRLDDCKAIETDLDATWIGVDQAGRRAGDGLRHLTDSLGVVRENTVVVSGAAEQASANASSVATATEEIDQAAAAVEEQSAANGEIGRSATNSADGASQVSGSVLRIRDQTDEITAVAGDVRRIVATWAAGR